MNKLIKRDKGGRFIEGNSFWLGKFHTLESKKKMSESRKKIVGLRHTERTKQKMSKAKKGKKRKPFTAEHIENLKRANGGKNNTKKQIEEFLSEK